jgi:HNH endonuclease
MANALRKLVRERAGERCEYCHLPDEFASLARFHVEHVIARKHGGADAPSNRCWSCHRCNLCKSSNLTGIDGSTGRLATLFHPRRQQWNRHFRWSGPSLNGLTATGRATIAVLDINNPRRLELRQHLIAAGVFPDE